MQKLYSLQGLRFLAFILIFCEHAGGILWKTKYMSFGSRGVEIFFVLSGFLVAYNYRDSNIAYNLKASFFYMLSKLRKFYALHIIIFLIILFSMERHGFHYVSGIIGFIRDVFLNITLLQSWYDPSKFTFNGVTWFLSCIVFAYFCVPFIVHFFKKNRGGILDNFSTDHTFVKNYT